jgi:hypothetical protein
MRKILVTPRSLMASPHLDVERLCERGYKIAYCEAGKLASRATGFASNFSARRRSRSAEPAARRS